MEKKNTILLTVIAVATLLVAVVGATFAYYSLNVEHATGTVNVGAQTDELGQIALTSKTGSLSMTVFPADMANFGEVRDYYATSDGQLSQTQQKNEIASVSFTKAGAKDTKYLCTSKVKVTLEKNEGSMGSALRLGDAAFVLTSDSDNVSIVDETEGGTKQVSLDLSTLNGEEGNTEEYTVTYILESDGTTTNKEEKLLADLKITNKEEDQSHLTDKEDGKELKVTVETISFGCEIAKIG